MAQFIPSIQLFDSTILILHFLLSFLLNIISALIIIVDITRYRSTAQKHNFYYISFTSIDHFVNFRLYKISSKSMDISFWQFYAICTVDAYIHCFYPTVESLYDEVDSIFLLNM